jgi:hypothetical protein
VLSIFRINLVKKYNAFQIYRYIYLFFIVIKLKVKRDFSLIHLPLELVVDEAEVAIFLLFDAPCTILSTPIIKRLTANIHVRINIPTNGFINSINDMPIDNIFYSNKECS